MDIKIGYYVEKWTLGVGGADTGPKTELESCGFVIQILGEKIFYEDSNRDIFCTLFKELTKPSEAERAITSITSIEDCEGSD